MFSPSTKMILQIGLKDKKENKDRKKFWTFLLSFLMYKPCLIKVEQMSNLLRLEWGKTIYYTNFHIWNFG